MQGTSMNSKCLSILKIKPLNVHVLFLNTPPLPAYPSVLFKLN